MDPFLKFLMGGAGAGLLGSAYNRLADIGQTGFDEGQALAEEQMGQTQFRPYTITSGTGGTFGAQIDPRTGALSTTMGFSPQEQMLSQGLFGQASQFLNQPAFGVDQSQQASGQAFGLGGQFMEQAGMSTADRETAIYDRMRATQRDEEQRQSLGLEERLAAQGRLGVRTAQYGGTPEQLAMAKAQEEAKSQAMLGAMGQARAEQAQTAALGSQFAGLGANLAGQGQALTAGQQQLGMGALMGAYLPQQQLIAALSPGQTAAAQQQQSQLYGAGLFGEARASGLDMLLASALGQANLAGSLGGGLLSGSTGFDFNVGIT
tara:strand:+ start:1288 stop:2244 length:957 start_codon:yes stop_codon:yes gene_type:complete